MRVPPHPRSNYDTCIAFLPTCVMTIHPARLAAAKPESASAHGALAALALSMLLSALGVSIANVGLPAIAQAFAAPVRAVQWIVLAYLLVVTALVVGAGRLGDTLGRRRLLLAGLATYTAGAGLCGLAPTLWLLVGGRAVQGIGAAVMMALTMAMAGAAGPKERTGRAMGLLGSMTAAGTALGPSLGGLLIAGFGWRALFFGQVPAGLLAWWLARRYLPADHASEWPHGARFDYWGTAVLAMTLTAFALAMTRGKGTAGLLVLACVGLAGFYATEKAAPAPLVSVSLLRSPVLSGALLMSTLVTTVVMGTLVVGPFYLARGLGLGAAQVGMVMSCGPAVAALAGVPAGLAVDRFGHWSATLAGLAAMAVGAGMLPALASRFGVPGYVAPLGILTAGYALFQAANNTALMAGVAAEQRGAVSGVLNLSRNLGLISGASFMGAVFAHASSSVEAGVRLAFGVATLLVLLAITVALATAYAMRRH